LCSEKPARKGQLGWSDLKARLTAFLAAYAEDISEGRFPVLPVCADPQQEPCRYCDFQTACRLDEARLFEFERKPVGVKFLPTRPGAIKKLDKVLDFCEMLVEDFR
jgi:hypothetical protein